MTKAKKEELLLALENVNPFNIDNDLSNIANEFELTFSEIEIEYNKPYLKSVKLCKKYIGKDYEIGKVLYKLFDKFIDESDNISRQDILQYIKNDLGYSGSTPDEINYLLNGSLGTLRCLHLIKNITYTVNQPFRDNKEPYNKKSTYYTMEVKNWFVEQRYFIQNKHLLKTLAPVLIQYSRSSISTSVPQFFDKIDSILEYVLQPFENHNENFHIEKYLIGNMEHVDEEYETTLAKEMKIRIIDKDKTDKDKYTIVLDEQEIHTSIIKIIPKRIVFDNECKYLEYEDTKNNFKKILLSHIIRVMIEESELPNNMQDTLSKNLSFKTSYIADGKYYYICHPKYSYSFVNDSYFKEDTEKIILELPHTALEYFKIKPLADMTIYATDKEKKTFKQFQENRDNAKITISGPHFYVTATDTIENATSIVMHVMQSVKIIKPVELKHSVHENMKQFNMNNNL